MLNFLHLILIFLRPLGFLYGKLMAMRSLAFSLGLFSSHTVDVPVISVGNLTMGGSGKTPVVMYLARLLKEKGFSPAVISRGYKGAAGNNINIVSDGKATLLSPVDAGDEPYLIAQSLPDVPVLTGKKRIFPSLHAVNELHCDIIILDDGFQHLSLKRNLDLVLFNSRTLNKFYHVFPSGLLREAFSALKRSQCIIYTNTDEKNISQTGKFHKSIAPCLTHSNHFFTQYVPTRLVDAAGNSFSIGDVSGRAAAFCGIASPERFEETLAALSFDPVFLETFADHHQYTPDDIANLERMSLLNDIKILLTTQKDLVKLKFMTCSVPILAVAMDVKTGPEFDKFILSQKFLNLPQDQLLL